MVVKIRQDEFFPADIVLLGSSAPKGICYVETKNLDGETNLKHKQGVKELVEYIKAEEDKAGGDRKMSERSDTEGNLSGVGNRQAQRDRAVLEKLKGAHVECENPNEMLYKFEGNLIPKENSQIIPLGPDQMLLRGSSLRNTEYIYGLVVFTGHETKIMKNSVGSRAKFSKLELATNTYIILIVGI